jgi:hypothetical protein
MLFDIVWEVSLKEMFITLIIQLSRNKVINYDKTNKPELN